MEKTELLTNIVKTIKTNNMTYLEFTLHEMTDSELLRDATNKKLLVSYSEACMNELRKRLAVREEILNL